MKGDSRYAIMYGAQGLVIGSTRNSPANLKYDPPQGLDYTIIKITEPRVLRGKSAGITSHDLNQPPVIITLEPITPAKGTELCYSGSYSGLVCGTLELTNSDLSRANP